MISSISYVVGVHFCSISKNLTSSLDSYNYFSAAVMQVVQMHITKETLFKALRAYNISTGKVFPWYIRGLTTAVLPISVCFEISRWSSDYQPTFWKKRTIHWICDHIGICTYSIFVISSIALAIVGQPGILLGTIITSCIHQIHNQDILPSYYGHILTTVNILACSCFSQGAFSCLMSVAFLITELIGNTYFFAQPVQQELPVNNAFILGKTIDKVKNNPLHIHYKIELDEDVKEILSIFDRITWESDECKQLLSKDCFWVKRVDIHNTDPVAYVLSFRKDIENFITMLEACTDINKRKSIEKVLQVFIAYLQDHSGSYLQIKELILVFVTRLRISQQKGIDYLQKTAEEHYEKIKKLPLEQKVLQLLYKKRKKIFDELTDRFFTRDQAFSAVKKPFVMNFLKPYIQSAFGSHMGIDLFSKYEHSALIKASIRGAYADANISAEEYFCDQESNKVYNPQVIVDILIDALEADVKGNKLLCNAINQWHQRQGVIVDLEPEIIQILEAKQYLQLLRTNDEYYYQFSNLRHLDRLQLNSCYKFIKDDYKRNFQTVEKRMNIEGNRKSFVDAICVDVEQALVSYSIVEKSLISLLLKMGIFQ